MFPASKWIESLEQFPKQTNKLAKYQENLPSRSELQSYYVPRAKAGLSILADTAKSIRFPQLNTNPSVLYARRWIESFAHPPKLAKLITSTQKKLPARSEAPSIFLPKTQGHQSGLSPAAKSTTLPKLNSKFSVFTAGKWLLSLEKFQKPYNIIAREKKKLLARTELNTYSLPKVKARLVSLSDSVKSMSFPAIKPSSFGKNEYWLNTLANMPKYRAGLKSVKNKLPDVKALVSQLPRISSKPAVKAGLLLLKTKLPTQAIRALRGNMPDEELAPNLQKRNGRILDLVSLSLTIMLLILVWAGRDQLGI